MPQKNTRKVGEFWTVNYKKTFEKKYKTVLFTTGDGHTTSLTVTRVVQEQENINVYISVNN